MLYEARRVRQRDGMETRKGVVEMDGEAMGGRFLCEAKSGDMPRRGGRARSRCRLNHRRIPLHRRLEAWPGEPFIYGGRYTLFCRELSVRVTFLDATGVNPEVFQVVLSGLFSTEPDLLITKLFLASARACMDCGQTLEQL